MADLQRTNTQYHIDLQFADGDTRTLKLNYPKSTLNGDSITSCFNYAIENEILIGDKTGAKLTSFESINKLEKTTTTFDLT